MGIACSPSIRLLSTNQRSTSKVWAQGAPEGLWLHRA